MSPRFRGRLLFPIHDLRGRVVGLGGRLLVSGEPKYLNSPETDIFHKGKQLYNLHQAKMAIRKEESAILVEGYFDVLRLTLAGVDHVVAPLGTSLTPDQAGLIKRFAPAATLLYDSDAPGLKATSEPVTSCCAMAYGCESPPCRRAKIPTPWYAREVSRRSTACCEMPSTS